MKQKIILSLVCLLLIPVFFGTCSPYTEITQVSGGITLLRNNNTGTYKFSEPLSFEDGTDGMTVFLKSPFSGEIRLERQQGDTVSHAFSGARSLGISLADITLSGFSFNPAEPAPEVERITLGKPVQGYIEREAGYYRSADVTFSAAPDALVFELSSPWEPGSSLAVSYASRKKGLTGTDPVSVIFLGTKNRQSEVSILPKGGNHRIIIPEGTAGFPVKRVLFNIPPGDFKILSIEIYPPPDGGSFSPIPADAGAVLNFQPEYWRGENYELFSWDGDPAILIMDTRNYRIQSAFFKRLAFYREKRGYRGRLLTDSELEGIHGWNAHNYGARGLADFFTQVDASGFPLNASEEHLRELLIANGVIQEGGDGKYIAGKGGIISVSQESPEVLRQQFMNHEGQHALFYSNTPFREYCFSLWNTFGAETKKFWRNLLSWLSYSPDWEYLMVNEYQAYLLQFPPAQIPGYFSALIRGKILPRTPGLGKELDNFLTKNPGYLEETAIKLARVMYDYTGILPGRFNTLRPASE
ncbi:MAG: hypothetical protein ACLFST_02030 [Spirochaetia bacterium]